MTPLLFLALAAGAGGTVERAGVVARAVAEPDAVALIDATTLTLTVEADAPLAVEPVRFAAPPGWTLLAAGEPAAEVAAGHARWRQTFRLAPKRFGELPLPPPPLRVRAAGRQSVTEIDWEPLVVRVSTRLADATLDEARGVAGPIRPPAEPRAQSGWLVAAAGLAASAAIAYLACRRRRPSPEPSAVERAVAQLAALAPLDAAALDALLRNFLARGRGVPADRRTTAELAGALDADWLALLRRCDLAKYAGQPFDATEWPAVVSRARSLLTLSLTAGEETPVTGSTQTGKNGSSHGDPADDGMCN